MRERLIRDSILGVIQAKRAMERWIGDSRDISVLYEARLPTIQVNLPF